MWILDFGGQGGAVQPHPRKKPGGRTLMFKREMNASPGLRICEGDQEEGKEEKTEQVPVLLSPSFTFGLCFMRELVPLGISSLVLQRQSSQVNAG